MKREWALQSSVVCVVTWYYCTSVVCVRICYYCK